jgi:hypothetical protein
VIFFLKFPTKKIKITFMISLASMSNCGIIGRLPTLPVLPWLAGLAVGPFG